MLDYTYAEIPFHIVYNYIKYDMPALWLWCTTRLLYCFYYRLCKHIYRW